MKNLLYVLLVVCTAFAMHGCGTFDTDDQYEVGSQKWYEYQQRKIQTEAYLVQKQIVNNTPNNAYSNGRGQYLVVLDNPSELGDLNIVIKGKDGQVGTSYKMAPLTTDTTYLSPGRYDVSTQWMDVSENYEITVDPQKNTSYHKIQCHNYVYGPQEQTEEVVTKKVTKRYKHR